MEYASLTDILDTVKSNKLSIIIASTKACGVCVAIKPRIQQILGNYTHIKPIYIDIDSLQSLSGEFMIFTVPTIILFAEGKEVHRESRIIDFKKLEFEISRWGHYLK